MSKKKKAAIESLYQLILKNTDSKGVCRSTKVALAKELGYKGSKDSKFVDILGCLVGEGSIELATIKDKSLIKVISKTDNVVNKEVIDSSVTDNGEEVESVTVESQNEDKEDVDSNTIVEATGNPKKGDVIVPKESIHVIMDDNGDLYANIDSLCTVLNLSKHVLYNVTGRVHDAIEKHIKPISRTRHVRLEAVELLLAKLSTKVSSELLEAVLTMIRTTYNVTFFEHDYVYGESSNDDGKSVSKKTQSKAKADKNKSKKTSSKKGSSNQKASALDKKVKVDEKADTVLDAPVKSVEEVSSDVFDKITTVALDNDLTTIEVKEDKTITTDSGVAVIGNTVETVTVDNVSDLNTIEVNISNEEVSSISNALTTDVEISNNVPGVGVGNPSDFIAMIDRVYKLVTSFASLESTVIALRKENKKLMQIIDDKESSLASYSDTVKNLKSEILKREANYAEEIKEYTRVSDKIYMMQKILANSSILNEAMDTVENSSVLLKEDA